MKCHCGFRDKKENFGSLNITTTGASSAFIAGIPSKKHGRRINVGTSDILICPQCGSLYCDPRGKIKNTAE